MDLQNNNQKEIIHQFNLIKLDKITTEYKINSLEKKIKHLTDLIVSLYCIIIYFISYLIYNKYKYI